MPLLDIFRKHDVALATPQVVLEPDAHLGAHLLLAMMDMSGVLGIRLLVVPARRHRDHRESWPL